MIQNDNHDSEAQSPGGDDAFVEQLVADNQRSRSWREKLDLVLGLLAGEDTPLTTQRLVDTAIYLRFLATGEIPCVDDGRHFRPAHHARIALQIQGRLVQLTTPETACIARKIYPWLPSSAHTFRRAEPLTRIRDIAHRNDIPQELKREIKHTLQNKLHRCAGTEDLVTCSTLLERITAPGANYPSAFVEQFKLFHEELKEFFNARSLDERLNALLPVVGASQAGLIRSFLNDKAGTSGAEHLAAFKALTALRQSFPDAAGKNPTLETQEVLMADIALEDFAFVLLSEIINWFEAERAGLSWEPPLDTLLLTITNLELSCVDPDECRALGAELRLWRKHFDPSDREQLLRLKATVDRARRLAEGYSDRILALFPRRVEQLGRALGVAEHAIQVFCEADIRGHVIFQLSKLVAFTSRRLREQLALPAWDVLVPGHAVGRVKAAGLLGELGQDFPEPVLALLNNAEGDEEIPRGVAGIVLAHELPHLSHLAVRARQAGVVLVTCEEVSNLGKLPSHEGQIISLVATPEKVEWESSTSPGTTQNRERGHPVRVPEARLTSDRPWISLEEVVQETGGGKADAARRLAELASRSGFKTPSALVVPFGVMDAALRAAPELLVEYRQLLGRTNAMADFTAATERLRDLIRHLEVPDELALELSKKFGPNIRLIARSSANCEDLDELAGAGLYESVPNVAPSEVAPAIRAVWSSLWTRRAALSRKQADIPHEQAHIAVLIQEMLAPDSSFVLHTVNPINHNPREVYVEIAVGLGETLVSAATRGNPYRMVCDRRTGAATTLAFANFSQALWPDPAGGVVSRIVDYSRIAMSCEADARKRLGRRLASIAQAVENAFGKPQDIEGAVVGEEIYLVQARPQQGLPRGEE
jgi:phosphoglucan,water dikinase